MNIVKIATLKSLSANFNICIISDWLIIVIFL